MNGFEHELQQRILGMVSDATISGYEEPLDDWRAMRARVLGQPDIRAAAPFVEGQALAVAGERLGGVTVRGVEPELEREVSSIGAITREGDIGALVGGSYEIVIGKSLADALGVGVGGQVVLVLAEAFMTPAGLMPRQRAFTVAGVFEAGMYEYDRGLVFVSFDDASRLFHTGGRATGLRLAVTDLYNAREVAERTARGFARELDKKFYVDDWTRQHYTYFRSIQLQKSIMFVILSLVIAVAAFNIVSTLMMVVLDKRGDIAILRSFGTTPRSVVAMLVSWQLGNIVALLQSSLGINLLSADVYFLSDLPTQLRPFEVAEIAVLALGLAILATLYPSFSAARQPPAEALRYE
jgi:lipoprotein-releasing system permease protein